MVRNQLENEQAAVPGHGLVRNAGSADAGGLSPRYSALRHSPFTAIQPVSHFLQTHQLPLLTGAQNMHEADQGSLDRGNLGGHVGETGVRLLSWDIQNDAPPLMKAMPRLIEKCIAP